MAETKITAIYDKDTFRTHRYLIQANEYGITGTVYVSKEVDVPKELIITMQVKDV